MCSPSRAEIMTGRYGFRTGWFHNSAKPSLEQEGGNLGKSNLIFAHLLKQVGYSTAITGKWQLWGTSSEYGFDEYCLWWTGMPEEQLNYNSFDGPIESDKFNHVDGSLPGRTARYWHPAIMKNDKPVPTTETDYGPDIFVDFLLDFAKRQKNGPFMVYYPMCLPHKSWDFETDLSGYLPVPQLDKTGKKTGNKVSGSLKSNIEYIDLLISRIVKGLETLGIRENTVILFTGDNGTADYGKCSVNRDRGQRVPMIVNGPKIVKPQGVVDSLIDFSDVLPTLCDLAGAELPKDYVIDGHSFLPALMGCKNKQREWIFSYYAERRMLRDKRWLLDGNNRFYDCAGAQDEKDYKDVTDSKAPEVIAARARFDELLKKLPGPSEEQIDLKKMFYMTYNNADKEPQKD